VLIDEVEGVGSFADQQHPPHLPQAAQGTETPRALIEAGRRYVWDRVRVRRGRPRSLAQGAGQECPGVVGSRGGGGREIVDTKQARAAVMRALGTWVGTSPGGGGAAPLLTRKLRSDHPRHRFEYRASVVEAHLGLLRVNVDVHPNRVNPDL